VKDVFVRRTLLVTAASLAVILTVLTAWAIRSAPRLRDRVVEAINARFESQVSLGSLDADMFPKPRAAGHFVITGGPMFHLSSPSTPSRRRRRSSG